METCKILLCVAMLTLNIALNKLIFQESALSSPDLEITEVLIKMGKESTSII